LDRGHDPFNQRIKTMGAHSAQIAPPFTVGIQKVLVCTVRDWIRYCQFGREER